MPFIVGWDDSTVVGISEWSPASDEGVDGCLPSECISEKQGTVVLLYCIVLIKLPLQHRAGINRGPEIWYRESNK